MLGVPRVAQFYEWSNRGCGAAVGVRNQELHEFDVQRLTACLGCHHRVDEEWHRVHGVANHAPAKGGHPAVLAFLDARLIRRRKSFDLDWGNADARPELHDARADEMILLPLLEVLVFDVLEERIAEDATVPEPVTERIGL